MGMMKERDDEVGSEFLKFFSTVSYEGRQCKGLGKLCGKQAFKHILKATGRCTP